jgi:hypothetical protein
MKNISSFLLWLAAVLGSGVFAAAQCPPEFVDLGRLSATAQPGRYQEVNVTRELSFDARIALDDSYRQKSIQAASDGAASDMRAAQIPAGFHLVPGGQGGGWWSIDNPRLVHVPATGNEPAQWVFRLDLYANTGGRSPALQQQKASQASSSVWAEVCVKPRNGQADHNARHNQNQTPK